MIRVLVVDDHAIVRAGLTQLLGTAEDLELVGEAVDGEQAVAMAASLRPDVVLMDLSMPGVDGVQATGRILACDPGAHVLVLTSFSDQSRIVDALQAGAEGYLLKHSEPEVILAGIRTSTVWTVGIATLSTPVGATSLGNYIFSGLQTRNLNTVRKLAEMASET